MSYHTFSIVPWLLHFKYNRWEDPWLPYIYIQSKNSLALIVWENIFWRFLALWMTCVGLPLLGNTCLKLEHCKLCNNIYQLEGGPSILGVYWSFVWDKLWTKRDKTIKIKKWQGIIDSFMLSSSISNVRNTKNV